MVTLQLAVSGLHHWIDQLREVNCTGAGVPDAVIVDFTASDPIIVSWVEWHEAQLKFVLQQHGAGVHLWSRHLHK